MEYRFKDVTREMSRMITSCDLNLSKENGKTPENASRNNTNFIVEKIRDVYEDTLKFAEAQEWIKMVINMGPNDYWPLKMVATCFDVEPNYLLDLYNKKQKVINADEEVKTISVLDIVDSSIWEGNAQDYEEIRHLEETVFTGQCNNPVFDEKTYFFSRNNIVIMALLMEDNFVAGGIAALFDGIEDAENTELDTDFNIKTR